MTVQNVNGCNATTEYGNPYKKTNKGKAILGTAALLGMVPIPKNTTNKIIAKLPQGVLKDSFEQSVRTLSKVPTKTKFIQAGIIGLVLFGVGALIDKISNKKRANKADMLNAMASK